jgi:hypothetical protein
VHDHSFREPVPSPPDRDLLFGQMGLQNGLVEQDVGILAFRSWTRDKSRPIAGSG